MLSLPCEECRLEPLWRDFGGAVFPGGHDSVDLLEALNVLGCVEPLVHEGNGALDATVVGFRFLLQ